MTKFVTAGLFDNVDDLKVAIERLRDLAFKQIGVAVVDNGLRKQLPSNAMGVTSFLSEMTPEEAAYYKNEVDSGGILLTVRAAVGLTVAEGIIRECNGRSQLVAPLESSA